MLIFQIHLRRIHMHSCTCTSIKSCERGKKCTHQVEIKKHKNEDKYHYNTLYKISFSFFFAFASHFRFVFVRYVFSERYWSNNKSVMVDTTLILKTWGWCQCVSCLLRCDTPGCSQFHVEVEMKTKTFWNTPQNCTFKVRKQMIEDIYACH